MATAQRPSQCAAMEEGSTSVVVTPMMTARPSETSPVMSLPMNVLRTLAVTTLVKTVTATMKSAMVNIPTASTVMERSVYQDVAVWRTMQTVMTLILSVGPWKTTAVDVSKTKIASKTFYDSLYISLILEPAISVKTTHVRPLLAKF